MRPRPCLPVLSASSCSAQAPKLSSAGRSEERHLVAPLLRQLAEPRAQLERFFAVERLGGLQQALRTSMPMAAAGTSPKNDSAEKRPPMSGGFRNTRWKPSSSAARCKRRAGVGDGDEVVAGRRCRRRRPRVRSAK